MKTKKNITMDKPLLIDGGLETTMVFHHGIELNHFAAFQLLTRSKP